MTTNHALCPIISDVRRYRRYSTYVAGDLVDVLAMHELGRHGHVDQLALGVVVLLSVAQLGLVQKKTSYAYLFCCTVKQNYDFMFHISRFGIH